MSSHRGPAGRAARRSAILAMGLLAAAVAGGCTAGRPQPVASLTGPATPAPPASDPLASPGEPAPSAPAASGSNAATPSASGSRPAPRTTGPSPGREVDGPPSAVLVPPSGDAVPGDLGGYTWAGSGSDAPWLVPPADRAVGAAGPYALAFDPPLPVLGWTARWARALGRAAGDPAGFEEGGAGPVLLDGPTEPGTWTMQVDARFAGGGRAAWYWLIRVGP